MNLSQKEIKIINMLFDNIFSLEDRKRLLLQANANYLFVKRFTATISVVYGLYVLFNSTLYDCYYRILNGSTQVNSTEINSMPMPPMSVIEAMGKELIQTRDMSETSCDRILRSYV